MWSISNEYFIYKPEGNDDDSDCWHIMNLRKENATILLKDFIKDPTCLKLVYHDGILYSANLKRIHAIKIADTLSRGEIRRITVKPYSETFEPGQPIHALFLRNEMISTYYNKMQVIIAMETNDN